MSASSWPGLALPKPPPRVVDKHAERLAKAKREREAKSAVRARDGKWCVVCGWRRASEVHEALQFRSRGGEVSLENSIYVCAQPSGVCHQLMQQGHRIDVEGNDCNKRLTFRMPRSIAAIVLPKPSNTRRRVIVEREG